MKYIYIYVYKEKHDPSTIINNKLACNGRIKFYLHRARIVRLQFYKSFAFFARITVLFSGNFIVNHFE